MKNEFNRNENRFGNRRFAHENNGNCKEEKGMRNTRNDFNRHDNNRPGRFENGFGRFENGCGAHKHGCRTGNGFGRPECRPHRRQPDRSRKEPVSGSFPLGLADRPDGTAHLPVPDVREMA